MAFVLVAAWLGFLALLVKFGVLKGWATWMKASPVAIWLFCQFAVFVPMGFDCPSSRGVIMTYTVQIIPGVSGVVEEVQAVRGTPIREGEILFKLEPTLFQADVDRLEAQRELAQQAVDRHQEMESSLSGSTSEVEIQNAVSSLKQVEAELTTAQTLLEYTIVRAPADGYVTTNLLRPGTRVIGNTTEVMSFVVESFQPVLCQIQQSHLRKIEPGQPAEVIFKMFPGQVFEAEVIGIVRANAEGQFHPSGFVPKASAIENEPFWVGLRLKDESLNLPPGAVGTVAIYTKPSGVTRTFRKIILRMQNWLNYIMIA